MTGEYGFPIGEAVQLGHPTDENDIFKGGAVIGNHDGAPVRPDNATVELLNAGWVQEHATRSYGYWVTVENDEPFYYEFYETNNGFRHVKKLRVDDLEHPKEDEARMKLRRSVEEYEED